MFFSFLLLVTLSNAHFFGNAPIFEPKNMKELKELETSNVASILMMYAPWCGHCKHLAPEFGKAAANANGKVVFAAVNCEEHQDICEKYQVRGYPTVKYFEAQKGNNVRNGKDYMGAREAKTIENFMYSLIPEWIEKLPKELDTKENAVILFSDKQKRTLMYKSIAMNAVGLYKFYDCNKDEELMKKYNVEKFPTIIVQHNGEQKLYEGKMDFYSILDYLGNLVGIKNGDFSSAPKKEEPKKEEDDSVPYVNVHVLNDEMLNNQCNNKACLIMIFGENEDEVLTKTVAEGLKGRMHTLSFTCAEQFDVCNKLNVFYDTPTALVFIPQRGRMIRFVGGFNDQEVIDFGKDALIGKAGRIDKLEKFPTLKDRVADPYVPPVFDEEEDY